MEEPRIQDNTGVNEDDRMETEYQYVIGRVTQRDVVVGGTVVVPAGKEVTGADATAALTAGALEELAFAVDVADHSRTEFPLDTEAVSEAWDGATEADPAPAGNTDDDEPIYEHPSQE